MAGSAEQGFPSHVKESLMPVYCCSGGKSTDFLRSTLPFGLLCSLVSVLHLKTLVKGANRKEDLSPCHENSPGKTWQSWLSVQLGKPEREIVQNHIYTLTDRTSCISCLAHQRTRCLRFPPSFPGGSEDK